MAGTGSDTFKAFQDLVESRRSVRIFTDEKIPPEVVERCLDLALLAPNSSNLQPWDFYWAADPAKKAELAKICFSQNAASTAAELIAVVARPDLWKRGQKMNIGFLKSLEPKPHPRLMDYYTKLVPFTYSADPFGINWALKGLAGFGVGLFRVMYRGPFGKMGNLLWATKTAALAAENLMLAFRAAGYDTCPMEGFDQVRARKLLGLPSSAYIIMIVGAGRAAPNGIYGPRFRGPREAFIHKV